MNYTSIFEPLLLIYLCLSIGILIGVVFMIYQTATEIKDLQNELDKFRRSNEKLIKRWKNKYVDDGTHEY
ncbi:MAG: hypothetical protein Unbinned1473contig1002_31 [Prokaryotic dsDNA virus sp.]|nr:MAG: hypothetical protein Unbinned1473contig1002_31 [Prokaryotic dsDNA virus sp.]|tara:strand:- start:4265 stop:4474 length:210 start_codon:yes stop_codon:yes gene_type:complete